MNRADLLREKRLELENLTTKTAVDKLLEEVEESFLAGYTGKTFGSYITPKMGMLITEAGFQYRTFSDGDFEESSIWI